MNFRADQFQYQPKGRVYVAEISELGLKDVPREINLDGSLFVFSHTNGVEDVDGWNYKVTMGGAFWNPEMANTRVLIIND